MSPSPLPGVGSAPQGHVPDQVAVTSAWPSSLRSLPESSRRPATPVLPCRLPHPPSTLNSAPAQGTRTPVQSGKLEPMGGHAGSPQGLGAREKEWEKEFPVPRSPQPIVESATEETFLSLHASRWGQIPLMQLGARGGDDGSRACLMTPKEATPIHRVGHSSSTGSREPMAPGHRGHIRSLKSCLLWGITDPRDATKQQKPGRTPSPPARGPTCPQVPQLWPPGRPQTEAAPSSLRPPPQPSGSGSSLLLRPGLARWVGSRSGPQLGRLWLPRSGGAELLPGHPRSRSQIAVRVPNTHPGSLLPASLKHPHLLTIFPGRSWLLAPSPPPPPQYLWNSGMPAPWARPAPPTHALPGSPQPRDAPDFSPRPLCCGPRNASPLSPTTSQLLAQGLSPRRMRGVPVTAPPEHVSPPAPHWPSWRSSTHP